MSRSTVAKRFLIAFLAAGSIVGVAALLQDDEEPTSTDVDVSSAPSTSPVATATTALGSASDAVATDAVTTDAVAPASTVSTLGPLPTVDLQRTCSDAFGDGALLVDGGSATAYSCSLPDGSDRDIDVTSGCERQVGAGCRAVLVGGASGTWRCSVVDAIELGGPDWSAACTNQYGDAAIAFLVADDSAGWRCAAVEHHIYAEFELALDLACQITFDAEVWGTDLHGPPDALMCYGAPAA